MKFTDQEKALILEQYLQWVDQVSDDCEEKEYFHADEIVRKVISLTEDMAESKIAWKEFLNKDLGEDY